MSLFSHSVRSYCGIFLYLLVFITGTHGDCPAVPRRNFTIPIEGASFPVGTEKVYTCDRSIGYYDIPDKSRTIICQDNSEWSVIPNFCQRACDSPPRLQYGELKPEYIDQNIFPEKFVVQYTCRPGYIRVPGTSTNIICLADFTWSIPAEFCKKRSCGNPGDIPNGELHASDFLFGSRVNYTCNPGYRMISRRPYRECTADGSWSNAAPECEAVICVPPSAISNGTFTPQKEEYNYQDSVTFSCNGDLVLNGTISISCKGDGTWSAESPQCIVVNCKDPKVENATRLSGFNGPYTLDYSVSFECKEGFTLDGSSFSTCGINSEWNPKLPQCTRALKSTLPPPTTSKGTIPPPLQSTTKPSATTAGTVKPGDEKEGDDHPGNHTGMIIGLIIGGLFLLCIIVLLVWCYKKNSGNYYCDSRIGDGTANGQKPYNSEQISLNLAPSKEK